MKKLILILLCSAAFGQSYNQNIIPSSTGLNLGSSTQRWNFYVQNIDFSTIGTCTLAGTVVPCFPAGLLTANNVWTGTNTFGLVDFQTTAKTVSTLPSAILNVGRVYRVTDGTSTSDCTVGGGSTTAICVSNGATWQAMGGGTFNPTIGTIPYKSGAATWGDSPCTVSGSTLTCGSGTGTVDAGTGGTIKGGTITVSGSGGITGSVTNGNIPIAPNGTGAVVLPTGTCTNPGWFMTGATNSAGFANANSTSSIDWCEGGVDAVTISTAGPRVPASGSAEGYIFTSSNTHSSGALSSQEAALSHPAGTVAISFDTSSIGNHLGIPQTLAATLALSTSAIGAHTCAAAQTTAMTGVTTSSVIKWSFASTPIGVTGYGDATTPFLVITTFPTSNTANVVVCNVSASSITPGSMTLNLRAEL